MRGRASSCVVTCEEYGIGTRILTGTPKVPISFNRWWGVEIAGHLDDN